MKKRAIFLDRDGTLNEDVGYPSSFSLITIYPFSYEAVRKINETGLLVVIVTNQSGIGRGLITEASLQDLHSRMKASFAQKNASIDGIYYCPHYSFSTQSQYRKKCACRKPFTEMARQAALDMNIDLSESYMVGDKVEDILFGKNIRARSVLVLTGFGKRSLPELTAQGIEPDYVAQNVLDAVNWILEEEGRRGTRQD
jgi:D-glycero-D-manno-heptose 1,7-bisphosphate phosphatase